MNSKLSSSLPSNTEIPKREGKEHAKAITLRSGKEVTIPAEKDKQPINKTKERESKSKTRAGDKDKEISPANSPINSPVISDPEAEPKFPKLVPKVQPPPFPQRLRKVNQDKQFG